MHLKSGYKGQYWEIIENAEMEFFAVNLNTGEMDLGFEIGLQLGYTIEECDSLEKRSNQIHPDDKEKYEKTVQELIDGLIDKADIEVRVIGKDGSINWVKHTSMIQKCLESGHNFFVGILKNITSEKMLIKKLSAEAIQDTLTGIYNRRFFEVEMKRLDTNRNYPLSIIIGDINNLKELNDSMGHIIGDELIVSITNAMKSVCRKEDILARWGGDEFAILLPNTSIKTAESIITRINKTVENANFKHGNISIALGAYTKQNENENIDFVFKQAENAMYLDKKGIKS